MTYVIPLVLSTTGIIPNKLHETFKMLNLRPDLYILMQEAEAVTPSATKGCAMPLATEISLSWTVYLQFTL